MIGVFQQETLKQVAFWINFKYMTSQDPVFDAITTDSLTELDGFKKTIEAMENPPVEAIPKLTRSRQFEFFDEFTEFLNGNIGAVSGRPLAYVVRKEANIINDDTQAPHGELDS